jgi:uncharacterized protein YrrD
MAREMLDQLRHGAPVYGSDGERLGKLHAIVVDPRDNEVTHIAVNAGPHFPEPGFGDPKIVSVDIERLRDATDGRVDLDVAKAEFADLPLYEHTHFFTVPDAPPPPEPPQEGGLPTKLWNAGVAIAASLSTLGSGLAIPAEHFAKASFERHILNDSPVWRIEPHEELGEVEQVIVDEETDELVGFVMREGGVFREQVVLPIGLVTEIRDGVIRIHASDEELAGLETYRR